MMASHTLSHTYEKILVKSHGKNWKKNSKTFSNKRTMLQTEKSKAKSFSCSLKINATFLVVKVNWSSSVFNDSQTHLNTEEDQNNEQTVVKVSESAHQKICLHFAIQ